MRRSLRCLAVSALAVLIGCLTPSIAHADSVTVADSLGCSNGAMAAGGDGEFPLDLGVTQCQDIGLFFAAGANRAATYFFDNDNIRNTLSIPTVVHDMTVNMSAFLVTPGDPVFLSRLPAGSTPELFRTDSFGDKWVYFRVEDLQGSGLDAPPQQGTDYTGNWRQTILWFTADGNLQGTRNVLHNPGEPGNFTDVITVPGSFNPNPTPCGAECIGSLGDDPTIGGEDPNFSDTTVVINTAVPEPSSLILLASGLLAVRARRRR